MKRYCRIAGLSVLLISGSAMSLMAAGRPAVTDLTEQIGMRLYKDKNLSFNGSQSCQTCHHPLAGFADRSNFLHPDVNMVSLGADGISLGGRNAPTSAYAGYSPELQQDANGEWFGGMFWDGRMDGSVLGDPLAEQAQGPPLNEVEMAMPDADAVLDVIMASDYYSLWLQQYPAIDKDRALAWNNFARAVAAYERSPDVTKFNSKYDVAQNNFTDAENRGLNLFENKCASCHPNRSEPILDVKPPAALFTTYGYANIGVPVNEALAANINSVYSPPDYGLGTTLLNLGLGLVDYESQNGKFKIPTLRNIAVTAPYSHNGNFPTLKDMVSFINDSSGYVPEVNDNISADVGSLGLTDTEIDDIIAFLNTLTDDY